MLLAWVTPSKARKKRKPKGIREKLVRVGERAKAGLVKAREYQEKIGRGYAKVQKYAEAGQRHLESQDLFGLRDFQQSYGQPTKARKKGKKRVVIQRPRDVSVLILGEEEEE